jgi:pimeloyl-ACP methyl ester carboxylesterase
VHEQADDPAALIDALAAAPAIVIGRSYGGAVAVDLALRYPDRVRALVQLEVDGGLSLSKTSMRELAELSEPVFAAADADMSAVGETLIRLAFGDDGWEGLPDEAKEIFTGNGPRSLPSSEAVFLTSRSSSSGRSTYRRCWSRPGTLLSTTRS